MLGTITFRLDPTETNTDGAAIDLYVSAEAIEVGASEPLVSGVRAPDAVVYKLGEICGVTGWQGYFFFSH